MVNVMEMVDTYEPSKAEIEAAAKAFADSYWYVTKADFYCCPTYFEQVLLSQRDNYRKKSKEALIAAHKARVQQDDTVGEEAQCK